MSGRLNVIESTELNVRVDPTSHKAEHDPCRNTTTIIPVMILQRLLRFSVSIVDYSIGCSSSIT